MNKKVLLGICVGVIVAIAIVGFVVLKPLQPTERETGQFLAVFSPNEVSVNVDETKAVTITLTSDGYEGKVMPFISYGPPSGLDVFVATLDSVTLESDSVVNVNFTFRFYEVGTTDLPSSMSFTVRWWGNWEQDNQFFVVCSLSVEIEE